MDLIAFMKIPWLEIIIIVQSNIVVFINDVGFHQPVFSAVFSRVIMLEVRIILDVLQYHLFLFQFIHV